MRDAMGGSVTLVIIVVFIVFALGYMAFNVNYTKAFRMKDKIITVYDDYKGVCNDDCFSKIEEYAKEIGYDSGAGTGSYLVCPNVESGPEFTAKGNLYCYREIPVTNSERDFNGEIIESQYYYEISTRINAKRAN